MAGLLKPALVAAAGIAFLASPVLSASVLAEPSAAPTIALPEIGSPLSITIGGATEISRVGLASSTESAQQFYITNERNGTLSVSHSLDAQNKDAESEQVFSINIGGEDANELSFRLPLKIEGTLDLNTEIPFTLQGQRQWRLLYHDDFESNADGWSASDRQGCADNGDMFLGGYCKFADVEASKTFAGLPSHTHIRLTARYHYFDKWEGQYGYAKIEDSMVWVRERRHCSKIFSEFCMGINVCGDAKYADQLSTKVDVVIPHSEDTIRITFGSTLDAHPCAYSWGVDDVMISVL